MQGLAERLYMSNPASTVVTAPPPHSNAPSHHLHKELLTQAHTVETNRLLYLAYCFARAQNEASYSCHGDYGLGEDVQTVRSKVIEICKENIAKMAG